MHRARLAQRTRAAQRRTAPAVLALTPGRHRGGGGAAAGVVAAVRTAPATSALATAARAAPAPAPASAPALALAPALAPALAARRRIDPVSGPAALARYLVDMRRRQIRYAAVITVVVAALAVFAGIAWSRGETAHVTLHTIRRPSATLPLTDPSPTQQLSWRTSDRLGLGTPVRGGTVITYDTHTVRGRDARTGATTWSYLRTDRSVCTAVQLGGTTIAVYAVHGNCDEVTALDSGTGKRVWTRTLDKDGMPLNGVPSYHWTAETFVVATKDVIYALAVDQNGIDRWTYTRFGCAIERVAVGTSGVLIRQNCVRPRCAGKKMCAPGRQLLLRTEDNNENDKPNGDHITWLLRGNDDLPVSAGPVISALNRTTGRLDRFAAANGRSLGSTPLLPVSASTPAVTSVDTATADVVLIGGVSYAVTPGRGAALWSARTGVAPTVVPPSGADAPADLSSARISVPTAAGIEALNGTDGSVQQSFAVPGTSGADVAYPLGSGFLVGGSTGIACYR